MVDNNIAQEMVPVRGGFVGPNEALVNLTWGQNYDLRDPVPYDITEDSLRGILSEIIRTGGDGIPADENLAPLANFVISRYEATETRPHRLITVRPKTSFG